MRAHARIDGRNGRGKHACKGGQPAGSNFDWAGPLTEVVLLGNVALRGQLRQALTRHRLDWDPAGFRFTNLAEANSAVTGAGGDVKPLPAHIADINGNLTAIDTSLKPIPAQADQIITNLTSIQGSLTSVDGSLKSTSGTLVGTSGSLVGTSNSLIDTANSLVDTSGILGGTSGVLDKIAKSLGDTSNVLTGVKGTAVSITGVLEDAEHPADGLGAHNIYERVATANGVLNPAHGDAGNILGSLVKTNASLKNVCTKLNQTSPCG